MGLVRALEAPDIIYGKMYEETKRIFLEKIKPYIDGETFIEKHEIHFPCESGWHCIANANIRISLHKCDRIVVNSIISIVANYSLQFEEHIGVIISEYSNDETSIINFDIMKHLVYESICQRCRRHIKNCKCYASNTKNKINKSISEPVKCRTDGELTPEEFLLFDDTTILMKKEEDPIDFNKYQPVINGLIQSMKIKDKKEIQNIAHSIIKENKDITEEELVQSILKLSNKVV